MYHPIYSFNACLHFDIKMYFISIYKFFDAYFNYTTAYKSSFMFSLLLFSISCSKLSYLFLFIYFIICIINYFILKIHFKIIIFI